MDMLIESQLYFYCKALYYTLATPAIDGFIRSVVDDITDCTWPHAVTIVFCTKSLRRIPKLQRSLRWGQVKREFNWRSSRADALVNAAKDWLLKMPLSMHKPAWPADKFCPPGCNEFSHLAWRWETVQSIPFRTKVQGKSSCYVKYRSPVVRL